MLKTTGSTRSAAKLKKTKTKVGNDNIVGGGKVTNQTSFIKRKNKAKMAKFKNLIKIKNYDILFNSKNIIAGQGFFIPEARLAFTKIRQALVKALILHYFDSKYHIWIEIYISRYAISKILN